MCGIVGNVSMNTRVVQAPGTCNVYPVSTMQVLGRFGLRDDSFVYAVHRALHAQHNYGFNLFPIFLVGNTGVFRLPHY